MDSSEVLNKSQTYANMGYGRGIKGFDKLPLPGLISINLTFGRFCVIGVISQVKDTKPILEMISEI